MRTNNVVVLVLAVVMGGIAAFMARQWLQNSTRSYRQQPVKTSARSWWLRSHCYSERP